MNQDIKRVTKMYIKLRKACDPNVEECDDIENTIVNVIEENLKYYGIDKYDYKNEGGTTTQAFDYYVEEMVKKYYNIPNWFETEYGKRCIYIPHDLENITKIKNTLNNMKTKDKIIDFLNWYKETETTGLSCQFNYRIITKNEISKVIQTYEHTEIRINLQDFGYDFYNPIICWLNTKDVPTLMIMDWVCLKNEIDHWINYNGDSEAFIEKFKTPTLEDEIKEEYSKLHPEVRKAFLEEVIEFWNDFKDDIRVENGILESIDHNMMLVDAIGNCGPLFCNRTIEYWIEKIYNKEVRI